MAAIKNKLPDRNYLYYIVKNMNLQFSSDTVLLELFVARLFHGPLAR